MKAVVTDIDIKIGQQLKYIRKIQGFSLEELGKKVGVSAQQLQKYEKGINRVAVSRLIKIAHTLGKPPEYFYRSAMRKIFLAKN